MNKAVKTLNQKIKQQGYRMTRQREIVLDELSRARGRHPKADEIYQMVRKRMPHISFGTVYRNLRLLKELGLVRELCFGKSFSRFEASVDNHQHFSCMTCGKVVDIDKPFDVNVSNVYVDGKPMEVDEYRLEFYGRCEDCR
jgi:Fur family peroxide stress response transcriptional regulator